MNGPSSAPSFMTFCLSCLLKLRSRLICYVKRHMWTPSSRNNRSHQTTHAGSPCPNWSIYNLSVATPELTDTPSSPTATIASTTSFAEFAERLEILHAMEHFFVHPDCQSCTHDAMPVRPRAKPKLVHSQEDHSNDSAVFSAYSGECTSGSSTH